MPRLHRAAMYLFSWSVSAVCLAGIGLGQGLAEGTLSGAITPPGPLTIEVKNVETGVTTATRASQSGIFMLSGLSPGPYLLRAGAASSNQTVLIEPANSTEVQLRLIGALVEVVVRGVHDGTEHANELDQDDDGLLIGRGLQAEQAGRVIDGVSAEQALGSVPLGSGSKQEMDNHDDADSADFNTGPGHALGRGRHAGISYLYAEGSVSEFRVRTDGYSAQTAGAGGVLVSVTKQGGQKVHGSAFLHLRSDILAAKDPSAIASSYAKDVVTTHVVKPHDLRENFGLAIGGHVSRLPGLHYFVAGEAQRRGFPAVSSPSNPFFYALTPVQKGLLGTRGVSTAETATALTYLSSLTGTTDRRADQDVEFGRLDWLVKHGLATGFQYNRARWSSPAGLLESPVVARGRASLGNSSGSVDQLLTRVRTSFGNGVFEELQFGVTRDLQYETPQLPLPQEPGVGPGGQPPEVNIGPDGLIFGTPAGLSHLAYPDEHRFELSSLAVIPRGRHEIELGGSYGIVHDQVAALPNAAGTFRYDSGATGGRAGGLVDFITDYTFNVNAYPNGGCPSILAADHLFCFRSFSQSFGQTRVGFSTGVWNGFVQDFWKPVRRVSIHAGLRYEYATLPKAIHPNSELDSVFGARATTSILPEDRNNLAPRVAATFEPFGGGKGLIKIGYGFFFGRMPGATIASALTSTGLGGETRRIRIRPATVTACPQAPANGFGYPCSFTNMPDDVVTTTQSVVVFDRRFRLPVVQQGSVMLERELGGRTTLSFEAVVNEDRQLPTSTDINIVPSTSKRRFQLLGGTGSPGVRDGEAFVIPVYTGRITTLYGPVTDVVSNVNASYDGLMVRVASRPFSGLQIDGRYTWSKAIDFGQAGSAVPRTNGQFDPFSDGYDKGLSSLNYPQALQVGASYSPRFEGGGRRRRSANGWLFSGVTAARSGRPYSLDISGGTYLKGGHESINGSGGALYLPTVGRNTLRLPATIKTDIRIARTFQMGSRLRGQATAEAFNLFNHQSVSSVNQRAYLAGTEVEGTTPLVFQDAAHIALEGLNTTPFGTRNGTGSSLSRERQVQLSLKATF